jgi:hypothetical protein
MFEILWNWDGEFGEGMGYGMGFDRRDFRKGSIDIIARNLSELLQGYLFEFLVEGGRSCQG